MERQRPASPAPEAPSLSPWLRLMLAEIERKDEADARGREELAARERERAKEPALTQPQEPPSGRS